MEIWDIYDENRRLTGRTMVRDDWSMKPGEFHISVIGAVQASDGRYLITQRKEDKPWGAGWWEFPGGGVLAGETPRQAIVREIREEVGLDVSEVPGEVAWSYKRETPAEQNNYFMDVYRFVLDFDSQDVRVQEVEVQGFRLATAEEIAQLGEQGIFLHYTSIAPML